MHTGGGDAIVCASKRNFHGFCLVWVDLHEVFLGPLICLISCHLQLAVAAVRGARLPESGIFHVLSDVAGSMSVIDVQ